MLWEAGCSVTIQVRLTPSELDWAFARSQASEKLKVMNNSFLSDTFCTFCRFIKQVGVEKEADGKSNKIRWNNAAYNANIHKASLAVIGVFQSVVGVTKMETSMTKLEMKYGRDVLSNQYGKIYKMIQVAKSVQTPLDDACSFLVDMLHLALNSRLTTCAKATESWLDRDRKHQKNGFWPACIALLEAGSANILN